MKIVLVKVNGKPFSVGVGPYCFEIDKQTNMLVIDNAQLLGSKSVGKYEQFLESHRLGVWAYHNSLFDATEEH